MMNSRSRMMNSRSQLLSIDVMMAVIIFAVVASAIYTIYDNQAYLIQDTSSDNLMALKALQVSDILVKSPGSPVDWDAGTVDQVGLSTESHVLNPRKVAELFSLLEDNETRAAELLGVGNYGLELKVKNNDSRTLFAEELGTIAYTDGPGGNPEEQTAEYYGLKDWLDSLGIDYHDYGARWKDLIYNISLYDTTVWEDPHLTVCTEPDESNCADDEMNSTFQQMMKEWVVSGGKVVDKEEGDWVTIFNMSMHAKWTNENCTSDPSWSTNGTVLVSNRFINSSIQPGDQVCFDEAPGVYNDTGDNTLVRLVAINDPAIPFGSYAGYGYWDYGQGRIFYMSDTHGLAPVFGENVRDTMVFFDQLDAGSQPDGAERVMPVERLCISSGELIRLQVVLWR